MTGRRKPRKRPEVKHKKSSLTTNNNSHKVVSEDPAVSRHIKVAHAVTQNVIQHPKRLKKADIQEGRTGLPRLTQRVGIFHNVMKSAPAIKDMLVPAHVEKKTNEVIRKLVAEVNEEYSSPTMDTDSPLEESSATVLDVDLEVQEIMASVKSLKDLTRASFHKRNLLAETKEQLQKQLKWNAPRCATPTPLRLLNKMSRPGSVQRSLMESFKSQHTPLQDHHVSSRDSRGNGHHYQPSIYTRPDSSSNFRTDGTSDINLRNNLSQLSCSNNKCTCNLEMRKKDEGDWFGNPSFMRPDVDIKETIHHTQTGRASADTTVQNRQLIEQQSGHSGHKAVTVSHHHVVDMTEVYPKVPSNNNMCMQVDSSQDFLLQPVKVNITPRSTVGSISALDLIEMNNRKAEQLEHQRRVEEQCRILKDNETFIPSRIVTLSEQARWSRGHDTHTSCCSLPILAAGDSCHQYMQFSNSQEHQSLSQPHESSVFMPSFHDHYYTDHMMSDLSWKHSTVPRSKPWDLLDYADVDMGLETQGSLGHSDKRHRETYLDKSIWMIDSDDTRPPPPKLATPEFKMYPHVFD